MALPLSHAGRSGKRFGARSSELRAKQRMSYPQRAATSCGSAAARLPKRRTRTCVAELSKYENVEIADAFFSNVFFVRASSCQNAGAADLARTIEAVGFDISEHGSGDQPFAILVCAQAVAQFGSADGVGETGEQVEPVSLLEAQGGGRGQL